MDAGDPPNPPESDRDRQRFLDLGAWASDDPEHFLAELGATVVDGDGAA